MFSYKPNINSKKATGGKKKNTQKLVKLWDLS